jgi:hypothetical protein
MPHRFARLLDSPGSGIAFAPTITGSEFGTAAGDSLLRRKSTCRGTALIIRRNQLWFDPRQLPQVTGTAARFTSTPHGDIGGFF